MQNVLMFGFFLVVSLLFPVPAFAADGICGVGGCQVMGWAFGASGIALVGLAAWGIICAIRGRNARICRETNARDRRLADLEATWRYAFALHTAGPTADTFRRLVFARAELVAELGGPVIQAAPNGGLIEPLPVWPPAPGGAAGAAAPAP